MAASSEYLTFAAEPGAEDNITPQSDYSSSVARQNGVEEGLADPLLYNKTARQASVFIRALSLFVANTLGVALLDDGNVGDLQTKFQNSLITYIQEQQPARTSLTGNLSIYVNSSSGNDAFDGLTPSTAFATPTAAYNVVQQNYDLAGQWTITFNISPGSGYTSVSSDVAAFTGPLVGLKLHTQCLLLGNAGSPTSVAFVSPSGFACIHASEDSRMLVSGISMSGGTGLFAQNNAQLYFQSVQFGVCSTFHINASHFSYVQCDGNYTIAGGAISHCACGQSQIHLTPTTPAGSGNYSAVVITLTGTPAFSGQFAVCSSMGLIFIHSGFTSFVGSATGKRYTVNDNSYIFVAGGGASYLPGSIAGTSATTTGYS